MPITFSASWIQFPLPVVSATFPTALTFIVRSPPAIEMVEPPVARMCRPVRIRLAPPVEVALTEPATVRSPSSAPAWLVVSDTLVPPPSAVSMVPAVTVEPETTPLLAPAVMVRFSGSISQVPAAPPAPAALTAAPSAMLTVW